MNPVTLSLISFLKPVTTITERSIAITPSAIPAMAIVTTGRVVVFCPVEAFNIFEARKAGMFKVCELKIKEVKFTNSIYEKTKIIESNINS